MPIDCFILQIFVCTLIVRQVCLFKLELHYFY